MFYLLDTFPVAEGDVLHGHIACGPNKGNSRDLDIQVRVACVLLFCFCACVRACYWCFLVRVCVRAIGVVFVRVCVRACACVRVCARVLCATGWADDDVRPTRRGVRVRARAQIEYSFEGRHCSLGRTQRYRLR